MHSICLVIPYFGEWPIWFEATLMSIGANPTVNWLCPTDCKIPETYPPNIKFIETNLSTLNKQVNEVVSCKVPLTPRKLCDLKPAYGHIFAKDLEAYDFWGFCDMDIIWGDIRKFISEETLNSFNIISSRKENISGHFTIFKNSYRYRFLYKEITLYKKYFELNKFAWFDETHLSNYLKDRTIEFKVKWDAILCNKEKGRDSHQEYYIDRWLWNNGKVINTKNNQEIMYLHFINWKKTMKRCNIDLNKDTFYISYNRIDNSNQSNLIIILNNFKNLFAGYYIKESLRKKRKKILKFVYRWSYKVFRL